jgi:DNA repair protein RecN (Recombination protein N)
MCSSDARVSIGFMLRELRIENLVLIEEAQLRFGAGLNAITGETGAGKTVLAHAIDLLLGGKSRKGVVRPGASEAWVEGLFAVPEGLLEQPRFADLRERLPEHVARDGEITLARRVAADGRTRAFVEGRSATAADLALLGGVLVTFLGQHEHRRLTLVSAQRDLLDAFAGETQGKRVAKARELHDQLRGARERLAGLDEIEGRRERELGLIEFELEEIEQLAPDAGEERGLRIECDRLRAVDLLRSAAERAIEVLDSDSGGTARAALANSGELLAPALDADATLAALATRITDLTAEAEDVARELRGYADRLEADPERLSEVEDRLDAYDRLARKHGGTVEAVIAHGEHCRVQRDLLADSEQALGDARNEVEQFESRRTAVCAELTAARRKAAPRLAKAVTRELAELALPDAAFGVEIEPRSEGPGPDGADRVEFTVAVNPGLPAAPLRDTASGGELSRLMLALLTTVESRTGGTYVFDEVDAGIGGRTARAVGERLRSLGERSQVICITHLPQVAALAHMHFQIAKRVAGDAATTTVRPLVADEIVEELRRMLGGEDDDAAALEHARELLGTA